MNKELKELKDKEIKAENIIEDAKKEADRIRSECDAKIVEMEEIWRTEVEKEKKEMHKRAEKEADKKIHKIMEKNARKIKNIRGVRASIRDKIADKIVDIILE